MEFLILIFIFQIEEIIAEKNKSDTKMKKIKINRRDSIVSQRKTRKTQKSHKVNTKEEFEKINQNKKQKSNH